MWKSVLTLVAVLTVGSPSFAQNYPMPKKVGETPAICTDCDGFNDAGEPSAGKPTYPYDAPLTAFAGRIVDSQATKNIQHIGMRTARAGRVRTAYSNRGTAPPRVYAYIGLGTFGAYSIDSFLATLKAPMVPVSAIKTGAKFGGRSPLEKLAAPGAWVYPESAKATWKVPVADSTERLKDFDFDDRGYVYLAYDIFGWGIVRDEGQIGGAELSLVPGSQQYGNGLSPDAIFTIRSGSKYYVAVSERKDTSTGRLLYDVTEPTAPKLVRRTSTQEAVIKEWAKHDDAKVIATLNADDQVRIYTYDGYVRGDEPLETLTSDTEFTSLSFDEKGVLWIAEAPARGGAARIRKVTASGGGYSDTILTPFPTYIEPARIHSRNGYVAVAGEIKRDNRSIYNTYIFKVDGSGLSLLDTGDFFLKYYHAAPSGYAEPQGYTKLPQDIHLLKVGTKTYLMYMAYGLGDVYQLEDSGPSLSTVLRSTTFGTDNPYSQGTEDGPFPGDPVTFRATLANATGAQSIGWNFGNPEASSGNTRSGTTGVDVTHQFTGLNTLSKVNSVKQVTATLSGDSNVSDSYALQLTVPEARIAIKATDALVTESGLKVLVGDEFVDASDGSVESHVAVWKIGNTTTRKKPDEPISVGALGEHTVELTAAYGKYDEAKTVTAPFNAEVTSKTYTVVPFLAALKPVTRSGSTVTYSAVGRFTNDLTALTATTWTYKWTLTSKGGTEKAVLTNTAAMPTIPPFPIDRSLLANEDVVKLVLSVLPASVPAGDEYATFAVQTVVAYPDPVIELTNCEFVNDICSIEALSGTPGRSTAGWKLSWTVKQGTTVVASGTTNPLSFKLTKEGTHNVSVTETVFDTNPVTKNFNVEPSQCSALPMPSQLAMDWNCAECEIGEPVTFTVSAFHYTFQECDTITWDFNDGVTATGMTVTHPFTSKKTYNVKVTIKNPTNTSGVSLTKQVAIGGDEPPPTCSAPGQNVSFTFSGPSNCGSGGANCKAGQAVKFTGLRGTGNLLPCDTANWTIDGAPTTDKSPSRTFTAGSHTVTLKVTNASGTSNTASRTFTIDPADTGGGACSGSATVANVSLEYRGLTSNCARGNGVICQRGETIEFTTNFFQYTQQACDRFEFNFDDGSAAATTTTAATTRILAGTKGSYNVKVKVYNQTNTAGVTTSVAVPFSNVPVLQPPSLSGTFPNKAVTGTPVTFTVTSNIQATGWKWEFDGVADLSKQNDVGTSSTITHIFTTTGRRSVRVTARNAADSSATAPTGSKLSNIDIEGPVEARFLLPIVGHAPGQAGSNWRTDVQFYNPVVGPNNPLVMQATFNGTTKELRITDSTFIYSDFMTFFTTGNAIGPVVISAPADKAPQIWTRTYNQSENGTFGQFIPAIRLDGQGGGAAVGSGRYYLAGLRHDDRYRTNVGFVNPNAQAINATVRVYDEQHTAIAQFAKTLPPLQYLQFTLANEVALPNDRSFYLEIEVPEGQWVIAYASYIDSFSNDPLYLQAVRETELGSDDFRTIVIPGVGHTGQWRSDVTIFNPDRNAMSFNLTYYDGAGVKRGEAKSVVLKSLESLQYKDILKQGVFGAEVPDGAGILQIETLPSPIPNVRFPLTFSRTYFDQPGQGTYGQAIAGVARSRANVKLNKPAIIPGVRSDENYYTNVGVTNLSDAPVVVTIKLLNPQSGEVAAMIQDVVQPNASRIGGFDFGFLKHGTIQVETNGGNVWAFASVIDRRTKDPEYVPASPRQ
ncbi:MAG TPA: PKD domain-containing protein [Thermoanaerobaculia bacterium]